MLQTIKSKYDGFIFSIYKKFLHKNTVTAEEISTKWDIRKRSRFFIEESIIHEKYEGKEDEESLRLKEEELHQLTQSFLNYRNAEVEMWFRIHVALISMFIYSMVATFLVYLLTQVIHYLYNL